MSAAPRFSMTYCSQCGSEIGPGDAGVSHCEDHVHKAAAHLTDILDETERQLAARNCRKAFRMGATLEELCTVPERYSIHGKSAWMCEAHRIIDEEIGKQTRELVA